MNNIIVRKLEKEIECLIEELANQKPESDEYKGITENINKLYSILNKMQETDLNEDRLSLENKKVENDFKIKEKQLVIEFNKEENNMVNNREQRLFQQNENLSDRCLQADSLKDSKIWNGIKVGVEVTAVLAPLVFYGVWMNRGLKFEEEGSFTSQTFKGLIGKFKPTK